MGSRTIGIVAHVDAGKTTLSEQMLYLSGALRTAGRVDHGSTALDAAPIERARGITVFSDQADFTWKGVQYTLMDTPGHVDFAAEVERALLALDAVILLADASEPLKPHGVMLAELAKRRGLPILLFLNKCDLAGAMPETVMQTAAKRLGMECVPLPPDPELVAQLDEAFLERYLAEDWTQEDCVAALRRAFESGLALPVTSGAALQGQGVEALLDALNLLLGAPKPQKAAPFRGTVYKVRRDEKGRRIVF
ncbi:MAG: GTP-binding protein [Clostridia bacterium]|nr:GTP-binding protein [Clostridia bacterium]